MSVLLGQSVQLQLSVQCIAGRLTTECPTAASVPVSQVWTVRKSHRSGKQTVYMRARHAHVGWEIQNTIQTQDEN